MGIGRVPRPPGRVWHGKGQGAKQDQPAARIEYWRSRYAYFAKHHNCAVRFVLRCGLLLRLLVDSAVSGLLTMVTFGRSPRWPEKFAVHRALLSWPFRGCPGGVGLPRGCFAGKLPLLNTHPLSHTSFHFS